MLPMLEPMQSSLRAGGSQSAGRQPRRSEGQGIWPSRSDSSAHTCPLTACGQEARHGLSCSFSSGVPVLSALLPPEADLCEPHLSRFLGTEKLSCMFEGSLSLTALTYVLFPQVYKDNPWS